MKSPADPHYRHRFPAEIISHAVWLYHVFSLSLRDVELLLAERGVGAPATFLGQSLVGSGYSAPGRTGTLSCTREPTTLS